MASGPEDKSTTEQVAFALAREVLAIADELAAEEHRIKTTILQAAEAGKLEQVRLILRRWIEGPVTDVLHGLEGMGQNGTAGPRKRQESATQGNGRG